MPTGAVPVMIHRLSTTVSFALVVLVALAATGCDDETGPGQNDGVIGDGAGDADISPGDGGETTVRPDGQMCDADGTACTSGDSCCSLFCNPATSVCGPNVNCDADGLPCTANGDCCSQSCGLDGLGNMVCLPPIQCSPDGVACGSAAECCSLDCGGGSCGGGGGTCASGGDTCAENADCCTNVCDGGTCTSGTDDPVLFCLVAGEACTSSDACCSLHCDDLDGEQRCVGGGICRGIGEVCAGDGDCCTGICESGRCQNPPDIEGQLACRVIGEPCVDEHDCCSFACVEDDRGYAYCRPTGGCTPFGEICQSDAECCNQGGRCNDPNQVGTCDLFPGRTDGRCSTLEGNLPGGAVCADGFNPGSQCCGGSTYCIETASGIGKCFGGHRLCPGRGGAAVSVTARPARSPSSAAPGSARRMRAATSSAIPRPVRPMAEPAPPMAIAATACATATASARPRAA